MEIEVVRVPSAEDWSLVKANALKTIWKNLKTPPDSEWKYKILISEHSPIRSLWFEWSWVGIKYWVANEIRTHRLSAYEPNPSNEETFISSQRNDRQEMYDRNKATQDAPINYSFYVNAAAIMQISQKRLCHTATKEAREAWKMALEFAVAPSCPELYDLCVPHCVYRGGICPEVFSPCGYNNSQKFHEELRRYRFLLENFRRLDVGETQ